MDIDKLQKRALEIREKYRLLEIKEDGREWSTEDLVKGFQKDVSDLLSLVQNNSSQEKIDHEISDCLWCVLVLAKRLNIDLKESFLKNMDKLEKRIEEDKKS